MSPFSLGHVTSSTGSTSILFGFTSQAYDTETGLSYHWNRYYDVLVGSWISEDPIGFDGRDLNITRYTHNSPTTAIDPQGLKDFVKAHLPSSITVLSTFNMDEPKLALSAALGTITKDELKAMNIRIRAELGKRIMATGVPDVKGWNIMFLSNGISDWSFTGKNTRAVSTVVVAWTTAGVDVDKESKCCNFSSVRFFAMPFAVFFSKAAGTQFYDYLDKNNERHTIRGPQSTEEHESWHTDGTNPNGKNKNQPGWDDTLADFKKLELRPSIVGYKRELESRAKSAMNDFEAAINRSKGHDNLSKENCLKVADAVIHNQFTKSAARIVIHVQADFHGPPVEPGNISPNKMFIAPVKPMPKEGGK